MSQAGDFYWNGSAANSDSQWKTKLNQMLAFKAGNGSNGVIPFYSRSMVPHWADLSNNAGYDMWNSFGQRYVTTLQSPGAYYTYSACKTNAQRLMLRPFRIYELPPVDCDPSEPDWLFVADDLTVGSTAGQPAQTFFAFATFPPSANLWPQPSQWTVAQSLESFERNTWRFWSGLFPFELYTHDYLDYQNSSAADRQSQIRQFSSWINPLGVRHIFMGQLGDYMYARNKSTLVSGQATATNITLTFTGKSTDPDGKLVTTKALVFYGDDEGSWFDIPGFTNGSTVTLTNSTVPAIGLSSTTVAFSATVGGAAPAAQTVSVTNTGGGTLNWSATNGTAWLGVSPATGTNSGTLTLTADISTSSAGTYTGNVTVSSAGASNDPQIMTVTLVVAAPPTLASIAVLPANSLLAAGISQQFTAKGAYTDGSTKDLTSAVAWTSTNSAVATIGTSGLAVGTAKGTTTIQAISGTIVGSTSLTVTAALASITVAPTNTSVTKGSSLQFTATGVFSDGSTQNLTSAVIWTSTNTAVATITAAGNSTATGAGSTTIQAVSGTITGTTGLTVNPAVLVSIAVTPAGSSIAPGATLQFIATGTYSDGSTQNLTSTVTWTSSATTVATITTAGLATAVANGNTTIAASLGSINGSTSLTVGGNLRSRRLLDLQRGNRHNGCRLVGEGL